MKNMCLFAGVFVATHTHARMVSPPSFGELPMSFRVMRGRATATAPVFSARWPLSAASFVWGGGRSTPLTQRKWQVSLPGAVVVVLGAVLWEISHSRREQINVCGI